MSSVRLACFRVAALWPLALALLLPALFDGALARAADNSQPKPRIADLTIGFDGHFKVGVWTRVVIELEGELPSGSRLELRLADGDGATVLYTAEVEAGTSATPRQVSMYVKFGQLDAPLQVTWTQGETTLAERSFDPRNDDRFARHASSEDELVLVLGGSADYSQWTGSGSERTVVVARIADPDTLPRRWLAYDGVDLVILATSQSKFVEQLAAAPEALSALETWISRGGRLIFSVGSQAGSVLEALSPLARFAPGRFDGMRKIRSGSAWETFAETNDRLDAAAIEAGVDFMLDLPRLADVTGRIDAHEGNHSADLPLVVRSPRGFGQIVFVAADLDQPPIGNWKAHPQLMSRLFGRQRASSAPAANYSSQLATLGYVDMFGQLRAALDQFDGVRAMPFWVVASLLVAYIAVIGPLDYLIVHKLLRRPHATWFTFPAWVLLFTGGAIWLAEWSKGSELRINQVEVIDADASSDQIRGTLWANLYSPEHAAFDLTLPGNSVDRLGKPREALLSWTGLPGEGFGGLGAASGKTPIGTSAAQSGQYEISPELDAIRGLPVPIWSTKGVTAQWWSDSPAQVRGDLTQTSEGLLRGAIESQLSEPLENCVLVFGRWAWPIGTMVPGKSIALSPDSGSVDAQTIETYFKRTTFQSDHDLTTPYDPASSDVPQIVEMLLFHGIAGGHNYTHLESRYLGRLDASSLVGAGRAVLLGRSGKPAVRLARSGGPAEAIERNWTFYRVVLPVTTSGM